MFSDEVLLDVFQFLPGEDLLQHKTFSPRWKHLIEQNKNILPLRIYNGTIDIDENGEITAKPAELPLDKTAREQNVEEFWNVYSGFSSFNVFSNQANLGVLIGMLLKFDRTIFLEKATQTGGPIVVRKLTIETPDNFINLIAEVHPRFFTNIVRVSEIIVALNDQENSSYSSMPLPFVYDPSIMRVPVTKWEIHIGDFTEEETYYQGPITTELFVNFLAVPQAEPGTRDLVSFYDDLYENVDLVPKFVEVFWCWYLRRRYDEGGHRCSLGPRFFWIPCLREGVVSDVYFFLTIHIFTI